MTDATPPSPPSSLEEAMAGVVLAERYRVEAVLGEGGMAVVFDGHHLGLDRAIAIKVLRPEFVSDSQVRARFEQEARAVSRLEHPGIVKMYDVGTAQIPGMLSPIAFLVMERLRGVELSDLMREEGPTPAPVALGWMQEMLAAIAHAHARGVVHRDLKPENVFACEGPDGDRVLKLVDFGIAKMVQPSGDAPLTQMGMIFGTPAYMSPEQATGHPTDARTDLYSAGIILFEMLSGHVPFASSDMMAVLRKHVGEAPPELPVPAPVSEILNVLLAKSPEDRYPDALAALAAVQQAQTALAQSPLPRAPTAPASELASATSPTAAAIQETLQPPVVEPPVSPAHATNPAVLESLRGTRERIEVSERPPAASARASPARSGPSRPVVLIGAAVAASAVLLVMAVRAEWSSSVLPNEVGVAVALPAPPTRASADALVPIDAKLDAGERARARTLLEPLLVAFPEDPALVWRSALTEGKSRNASLARARLVLRAVALDPARLEDSAAQAFVLRELERSIVPEAWFDLVLKHGEVMPDAWTQALLGDRKSALPYAQRHRLLDARRAWSAPTWDPIEHRCHDLWQAARTDHPCTVYAKTLDAMEATPSASYHRSVSAVKLPEAGPGEDAVACAGLEARRDAVLESIADADGDLEFLPQEYATRAKTAKPKPRKTWRSRARKIFR